jgi:hypothetical protein
MQPRTFKRSKQQRDKSFMSKDDVTVPLLKAIPIDDPLKFYAVLMPSLYGPEVFHLRERGVPGENLFAVEFDKSTHAVLCQPPQAYPHLQGICTTPLPAPLHEAIDRIPFSQLDLVYIDLFGQPTHKLLIALYRLFRLYPLSRGAVLLLTCGRNRGDVVACRINARLITEVSGQAYVEAALIKAEHVWYRSIQNHHYVSDNLPFTITEVHF